MHKPLKYSTKWQEILAGSEGFRIMYAYTELAEKPLSILAKELC